MDTGLELASWETEGPVGLEAPRPTGQCVQSHSDSKHQEVILYNHLKPRYFLKSINYFQLFSDDPTFFFFFAHNFMSVILSHQVNLMKALVPPPSQAPLSNHVCAPPFFLSS